MRQWVVAVLLVASLSPALAQAWWNTDWAFRKRIALDPAKAALTEGVAEAPILVRLHSGNFGYFTDMKPDGSDLRFIGADDKTPLKFHVEKFDAVNQMALIWVQVPNVVPNASQAVWMYYGNPGAPEAADKAGTYDVNQSAVLHFDGPAPQDATAYAVPVTAFTGQPLPAALIGAGIKFDGTSQLTLGPAPALQLVPGGGFSFSAWIKPDAAATEAAATEAVIMMRAEGPAELALGIVQGQLYARLIQAGAALETPHAVIAPGVWHHVGLTLGPKLTLYLDGKVVGAVDVPVPALTGPVMIGAAADDSRRLNAEMDQVDIAKDARPAGWFAVAYASQSPDAPLLTYGDDEQGEGGASTSYFTILLRSVTLDGWVVIAILTVMAVISWMVMASKGVVLQRMRRDNNAFLAAYRKLPIANTGALDQGDDAARDDSELMSALFGQRNDYHHSSLYRIYHTGIEEMRQRLGVSLGSAAAGITAPGIEAIRASLDATLVRETQRLNNLMVLLTIAISGGPFLGLLGTVVGVMITFAAIAATGDVNINAIAPGIAAALVATVAGLAVAIPALFGYNYLASRIGEITADMHVFIDQFVTRVAESNAH